ncbi:MAG: acetolactate decarboxylase, partial [Caldilineaceae bacterium]|nr:acetolactate decarboxylase [Caldilineaceae bacterium]
MFQFDTTMIRRWLSNRLPCYMMAIFFITLCAGCAQPTTVTHANRETLFQTSTLHALEAGVYDGEMTIGQLKQQGDFGLGTFTALDGEMVMVNGEVYRVDDQGVVHVVDNTATTPFAAVTGFAADETTALHSAFTCSQLQSYLDARLPRHDVPYALRVEGRFSALTVRSVPAQQKPYPPLADALAGQVVFEKQTISGSMIGFRLPDYLAGTNVAGYHFHFLSDDKQVGGHVLDCTTDAVTVAADDIADLQVDLLHDVAHNRSTADSPIVANDIEPLVVFGAYGTSLAEPWNQAIHQALLAAAAAGEIRYSYVDQIGYTGDVDQVLRSAIAEHAPALIVSDLFGNETAVTAVVQEHPEIAFVFGTDAAPRAPNLSVFDSWTHEAAYLAGMTAGGLTKTNVVGIVAGYPEGSVNRVINAFTAGAQANNPNVAVRTTFIHSWFDPDAAATAAQAQIDAGADVIFGERTGVTAVAAAAGVYVIGNMIDQRAEAPQAVVSSVLWNVRPTLDYVIDQVRNGSYTAQNLVDFGTLAVGGAALAPLNREVVGGVPDALVAAVNAKAAAIASGRFVVPVDDHEPPPSTAAIVLGALYNLTGAQSGLDIPSAQGAQLAVAEVNRQGGLLGRPVHLALADGESDPAVLAAKTTAMLADFPQVTAFLGLSDTDMVLGAAPVAAAAQRLFLTSGATSPQLPAQVPDYLYLACFGDNVQAAAAAEWAYAELSARRAAILYDAEMLYTQGL